MYSMYSMYDLAIILRMCILYATKLFDCFHKPTSIYLWVDVCMYVQ